MKPASKVWDRNNVLRFCAKELRAAVISNYVRAAGYRGAVVFTCGNAGAALRQAMQGIIIGNNNLCLQPTLVEVSPRGPLGANRWWASEEIHQAWPDLFDATSGHLPAPLMVSVANSFRSYLTHSPLWSNRFNAAGGQWFVPTGSGETIICLRIAFPKVDFCAVYDDAQDATRRDVHAPLNSVVDALFPVEHWNGLL